MFIQEFHIIHHELHLKQALIEVEKYKSHLKIAESLIGSGRPKETNNISLINQITMKPLLKE